MPEIFTLAYCQRRRWLMQLLQSLKNLATSLGRGWWNYGWREHLLYPVSQILLILIDYILLDSGTRTVIYVLKLYMAVNKTNNCIRQFQILTLRNDLEFVYISKFFRKRNEREANTAFKECPNVHVTADLACELLRGVNDRSLCANAVFMDST